MCGRLFRPARYVRIPRRVLRSRAEFDVSTVPAIVVDIKAFGMFQDTINTRTNLIFGVACQLRSSDIADELFLSDLLVKG
jgi:hypothetical protein